MLLNLYTGKIYNGYFNNYSRSGLDWLILLVGLVHNSIMIDPNTVFAIAITIGAGIFAYESSMAVHRQKQHDRASKTKQQRTSVRNVRRSRKLRIKE